MIRDRYVFGFVLLLLGGLAGCSSAPEVKPAAAAPPDKIQGKAIVRFDEDSGLDAALNAGGPSVYLVSGLDRYRLFLAKPFQIDAGQEYAAEGVLAQKMIDAIGDPDLGKNGYPLKASCERVVKAAWPSLAFDVTDSYSNSLKAKVNRFPARPVFLVMKIQPVTDTKEKKDETSKSAAVQVAADKQQALLTEGSTTMTAPLWDAAGGAAKCKVVIDEEGKIAELNSGSQLCEAMKWSTLRYKPTLKGGKPARVETEVEVKFDPRK